MFIIGDLVFHNSESVYRVEKIENTFEHDTFLHLVSIYNNSQELVKLRRKSRKYIIPAIDCRHVTKSEIEEKITDLKRRIESWETVRGCVGVSA
jgi:chromatin segregation and condensation protein Rec8/ScpA/Scc1 (kleisin family)